MVSFAVGRIGEQRQSHSADFWLADGLKSSEKEAVKGEGMDIDEIA